MLAIGPTQKKGRISMDTQKKSYIEFLRIAACFLVIVNHTNSMIFLSTTPSPTWFASLTYFFVCKTAVPIFLMIMGALLLEKRDTPKKAASRVVRIVAVLLISSALCYLYYGIQGGNLSKLNIVTFFQIISQASMSNAFWYLYLYLGLLCLLPLLQRMTAALGKRALEWLLFMTIGVMGALPLLSVAFPSFAIHPDFTAPLFSPYIGAVFCGYYIEHYVPNTKKVFGISLSLFVGTVAAQVFATFGLYQRDPSFYLQLDDRTFLPIMISAACFYLMARYVFSRVPFPTWLLKGVNWLGGLTFGIYLLGDLGIALLGGVYLQLSQQLPTMAAMILWELAIFAVCTAIAAVLKLIPGLRKLL